MVWTVSSLRNVAEMQLKLDYLRNDHQESQCKRILGVDNLVNARIVDLLDRFCMGNAISSSEIYSQAGVHFCVVLQVLVGKPLTFPVYSRIFLNK